MRAIASALVLLSLVVVSGCSGGSTASGCGVPSPSVEVVNGGTNPVEASAWQGETPVTIAGGSSQWLFPANGYAAPPWRVLIKDQTTGAMMLDRGIGAKEGPIKVTISSGSVRVGPQDPPPKGEC